jgi:hypothetical protein
VLFPGCNAAHQPAKTHRGSCQWPDLTRIRTPIARLHTAIVLLATFDLTIGEDLTKDMLMLRTLQA